METAKTSVLLPAGSMEDPLTGVYASWTPISLCCAKLPAFALGPDTLASLQRTSPAEMQTRRRSERRPLSWPRAPAWFPNCRSSSQVQVLLRFTKVPHRQLSVRLSAVA